MRDNLSTASAASTFCVSWREAMNNRAKCGNGRVINHPISIRHDAPAGWSYRPAKTSNLSRARNRCDSSSVSCSNEREAFLLRGCDPSCLPPPPHSLRRRAPLNCKRSLLDAASRAISRNSIRGALEDGVNPVCDWACGTIEVPPRYLSALTRAALTDASNCMFVSFARSFPRNRTGKAPVQRGPEGE